jgi:hypothetical protein
MRRKLFIWVEGGSDARFFEAVLQPLLEKKYNRVEVRTYASLKKSKVVNLLRGIMSSDNDYILVADIDQEPCVTAKKQRILDRFRNIDGGRIRVVIKEIESWYLAGLDDAASSILGLPDMETTDAVTKEDFNVLIPEKFDSRIDFMMEILKYFSMNIALKKNRSFAYFTSRQRLKVGAMPRREEDQRTNILEGALK